MYIFYDRGIELHKEHIVVKLQTDGTKESEEQQEMKTVWIIYFEHCTLYIVQLLMTKEADGKEIW